MATTTAKSATRANETKNAAANVAAASVQTSNSASTTRRSRIVVAGVPAPSVKGSTSAELAAGLKAASEAPKGKAAEAANQAAQAVASAKPETANSAATVQPAAHKQEAQPAAPAEQPRQLTAEEKAAELQKEIERKTKALQAALTELAHKKELNDHRTRFLKTLDQLQAAEAQLNETDEFAAPNCKISFETKPDGYRWDTAFSIGNAELQKEFITFIRAKIRAKVENIEAELIK